MANAAFYKTALSQCVEHINNPLCHRTAWNAILSRRCFRKSEDAFERLGRGQTASTTPLMPRLIAYASPKCLEAS
eukprot:scaffold776_cov347-Pavlova_lutheri.AAC.49